ncbi:unnamed protein product [Rotaria sp. Silwood1]|nr:unnamed protein product [Rotaria sp. Silwood1]
MDDDLAFCLQRFVKEQKIVLESTRVEQEKTYHAAVHENKKVDHEIHSSQGDQSETLATILEFMSKTIDKGYKNSERYIQSSTWSREQKFWTDILYNEFLQKIHSYDREQREKNEKIRHKLERRHRADQARVHRDILQLVTTLRILAVGSSKKNQDAFQKCFMDEQKLDRNRRQTNKDGDAIAPVIFGSIDDTSNDAELGNLSRHGKITMITLGRFGLNVKDQVLFPRWNRVYSCGPEGTYWTGSLNRAGKPYYCPVGWTRFAIKVTKTQEEFDQLYGDYHVAYHGTKSAVASDILNNGLQGSEGCYREGLNIYLSPSIEYSAHPRYATPWQQKETGKYYQMVLQCRVNPRLVEVGLIESETLLAKNAKTFQIDPNFSNDELEWILPADKPVGRHDLICYGLMIRITYDDPVSLPSSKWWKHVWWEPFHEIDD